MCGLEHLKEVVVVPVVVSLANEFTMRSCSCACVHVFSACGEVSRW